MIYKEIKYGEDLNELINNNRDKVASKAELARRLGLSRSYVCKISNNKEVISERLYCKILEEFGLFRSQIQ